MGERVIAYVPTIVYTSFPIFSIRPVDVSLFLGLRLVPFSTLPCGLGICGVFGALLQEGFGVVASVWTGNTHDSFFDLRQLCGNRPLRRPSSLQYFQYYVAAGLSGYPCSGPEDGK